jgi:hypothetical protein
LKSDQAEKSGPKSWSRQKADLTSNGSIIIQEGACPI